jgi:hypothetical protein
MLHFDLTAESMCIGQNDTPKMFFGVQNEHNSNLGIGSRKSQWSKGAKSTVKSKKGLIFDAIREQLGEVIKEQKLRSVPN